MTKKEQCCSISFTLSLAAIGTFFIEVAMKHVVWAILVVGACICVCIGAIVREK